MLYPALCIGCRLLGHFMRSSGLEGTPVSSFRMPHQCWPKRLGKGGMRRGRFCKSRNVTLPLPGYPVFFF